MVRNLLHVKTLSIIMQVEFRVLCSFPMRHGRSGLMIFLTWKLSLLVYDAAVWLWRFIGGSCHKYHFCRDKSFVVFVATKHDFWRDQSMLLTTKLLS